MLLGDLFPWALIHFESIIITIVVFKIAKKEMPRIKQAISFQLDASPKAAPCSYRQPSSYLFFKQTFLRVFVFLLI